MNARMSEPETTNQKPETEKKNNLFIVYSLWFVVAAAL
jgi:hypothetical protein